MDNYIDIVFDGPPSSHESGRFVEVENEAGASIGVGTWIGPDEQGVNAAPFWRLRLNLHPSLQVLGERIHRISTEHGFEPPTLENLPEKLMLSVSELAEAMEEHRSDKPLVYFQHSVECPADLPISHPRNEACRCVPKPEGILVEIADSIIRNLHMMASLLEEGRAVQGDPEADEWTIDKILNMKVAYNDSRPHKHGRSY